MNFKYYKTEVFIIFMVVLFLLCNYLANEVDNLLEHHLPSFEKINHLTHTLSTISLMTFVLLFLNYIGWKWKFFKWLIDLPNLNGRYAGKLVSSYNGEEKNCVIEIKQTASSIHIFAYFGDINTNNRTSTSFSVSEELVREKNNFFKLYYIFTNESEATQLQLNNHDGTGKFNYLPDIKKLDGEYYNKRMNKGSIVVTFEQKKILGRLIP